MAGLPAPNLGVGWILVGAAAVTLLGGWATGQPFVFLSCTLAAYLLWYHHCLNKLRRALDEGDEQLPRLAAGPWWDVYHRVQRIRARSRKRKRRLSRFIDRFREAAAVLPDATVVLNRQGALEWCNPATRELLGVAWPGASGRLFKDLVREPALAEYLDDRDHRRSIEFSPRANPSKVLSVRVMPFGKKRQRLLVARDVTDVYKLDRVRRDFVANVSHELRTPITVVSGFLENLAAEAESSESLQRPIELMRGQTERMTNLIQDLLTLSRLEMEDDRGEHDEVSVAPLLESIIIEARALSAKRDHRFHLDLDHELLIRGAAPELYAAFSNLVLNAVRHTPQRTDVYVTWRCHEGGARLEIRDTGPGIPARHLPRLSERFYRADAARSRDTGGTGLGLAIVKHVLERHGAELLIRSEPGRGSTFSCQFASHSMIIESDPQITARAVS